MSAKCAMCSCFHEGTGKNRDGSDNGCFGCVCPDVDGHEFQERTNLCLPWSVDADLTSDPRNDTVHIIISDRDGGIAALIPVEPGDVEDEKRERAQAEELCRIVNARGEKIDIRDLNDPVTWALVVAFTPKGNDIVAAHKKGEPFEVYMTVDGVEVQFSTIIRRFVENYDERLKERAVELLREQVPGIEETLAKVKNVVEDAAGELAQKLGVRMREW